MDDGYSVPWLPALLHHCLLPCYFRRSSTFVTTGPPLLPVPVPVPRSLQDIIISSPHIIRLPSQPWAAPSSFARTPRNDDADGGKRRHGGQTAGSNGRTDGDGRSHQRYATAPPRGGGAERCSRLYGHAMAAFAWLRPYMKPLISSALTLSFPPPPCHSPALRALPPPCHRSTCAEEFQSG